MKVSWTTEQQNAISATDGSILVSAAAGSGKTAVLAQRVINLISRENYPVDIDKLLIVTFTRAAAAEMKERIIRNIDALLKDDPYNKNLLRQKQLAYKANISTIDSFCSNLVREYFHTLEISSDYRTADESELEILKKQALDLALEVFYAKSDSSFQKLLDAFADTKGDKSLREAVLTINTFLSTQPFPNQWMSNMIDGYDEENISKSIWGKIIIEHINSLITHAVNLSKFSLGLLEDDEALNDSLSFHHDDDILFLTKLNQMLGDDWDRAKDFVQSYSYSKYLAPKGYKDHPIKLKTADNRDKVKKLISQISSYFSMSECEIKAELNEVQTVTSALFDLVNEFRNQLRVLKTKKNILSFADVEQLAVRLLATPDSDKGYTKTPQALEISKRFSMVIVDEFQDVNDVQNLIFNCVSENESNLFVVGDVKQSIYSFRQAKPQIFIERKANYNTYNSDEEKYPATIILDKNFRSRQEVCETVNYIFSLIMQKQICGMDYTSDERLNAGSVYPESTQCNFEMALIDRNDSSSLDKAEIEASYIADKIYRMINSDNFKVKCHDGNMRTAQLSDFAILLRTTKNIATKYVKVLKSKGIRAFCEEKESAFDAQEVRIILNFLKVIDNPSLEIELLSVLVSPIYGFTPDDLASIRSDSRKINLFASLKLHSSHPKVKAFLVQLDNLRSYSSTCSVDELIGKVLDVTGFGAITSAVVGGENALQNINLVRYYARTFEKNGYKTLSDFNNYIDRLVDCGQDLASAPNSNTANIDGVRVLSIHKSKGLEFPVCFIADSAHNFNFTDLSNNVVIDSKAGLGIKKKIGICRYKTFSRLAVELELKRNVIAEEMRVLYVALTRAKEKLIMISCQKGMKDYIINLNSKLLSSDSVEPYAVSSCKSYSDWVIATALLNPTASPLREYAGIHDKIINHNADCPNWKFEFIDTQSELENSETSVDDSQELILVDEITEDFDYAQILRHNLDFVYPNYEQTILPQKVSASQIAHSENSQFFDTIIARPKFISQNTSSAVERGTAHHLFLQYCNFEKARQDLKSEIERLIKCRRLTAQQAESIDCIKLGALLNTELFDRIIASPIVLREEQFTVKIKASLAVDSYINSNDPDIIMQGAVDLAFVEDGRLVIVDYKTDRVGEISKLTDLYRKQLLLYKNAMEQSTEFEVKELILCSVHLNSYISI